MIDLFKIDFLRKFSQKLLTHNLYKKQLVSGRLSEYFLNIIYL